MPLVPQAGNAFANGCNTSDASEALIQRAHAVISARREKSTKEESHGFKDTEHAKTPWMSIYIAGACAFIQAAQFSTFMSSMWPYLKTLKPQAVETEFGYIFALYSFGQCISAPAFGYWSNRIEQVRIPLIAGFTFMMVGNIFYLSLPFFTPSTVAAIMMMARLISGFGTGNMALLKAYVSTSSSKSDRARAIACVNGGMSTGTLIGPGFQLLFTPLGSEGIYILPFYRLNMYNAPALFSLIMCLLGVLTVLYVFEENNDVLNEEAAKGSGDLPPPCAIAVLICITTHFVRIFATATLATLGSPLSMMMFSFNKEQSVAANASSGLAVGIIGVALYFVFIFWNVTKLLPPLQTTLISMCAFACLFIFTLPFPFLPKKVDISINGSDWGCDAERFDWCHGLTAVSPWVYYSLNVFVFGFVMTLFTVAFSTLYSEIIGPRRQGTLQGVFQMAGSGGRLLAPLVTTFLYTKFGPTAPWILDIGQISLIFMLWIVFRRKMVPLQIKSAEKG